MGRTVGITLEGDGGHSDDGCFGEPLLQVEVFKLAVSQS
jgi:hypothetical protein